MSKYRDPIFGVDIDSNYLEWIFGVNISMVSNQHHLYYGSLIRKMIV